MEMKSTPALTSARAPWAIVLIAAALLPSVVWVVRDHTPWAWDQSWYGEVSVDLWFHLTHSMLDWARTMLTGLNMKPPGIVWLGQLFVPFGSLCGSIESALLISVLVTQAVTLYVFYQIGRSIAPESEAVPAVGVCFAAATQGFIGLSHQFFAEPLQALAVAWVVLIADRCSEWPAARTMAHLGGALILGLLAKATTPLYCLLPCLYAVLALFRRPLGVGWKEEWGHSSTRVLIAFIAVVTPLTVMWYSVNLKAVWQHIRLASSGEVALQYGFRASVARKLIVWIGLLDQLFLAPCLEWALILAIVAGLATYFRSGHNTSFLKGVEPIVVLCSIQCGILLLTFSANDTVDPRYMYPMLPLVIVVVMSFCAAIRSRVVLAMLFALCGLQFALVHRIALGASGNIANRCNLLVKLNENWGRYREMEHVVRATSTVPGRYNIVGVEEPWLNANTASFFAAKHRLDTGVRSYFTSLGYAQKDVTAAVKRVEGLNPMYYITLDEHFQSTPPDFLNMVSLPLLEQVRKNPHFEQLPAWSTNGVLIFRRH
jgi:hypothetical protein